MNFVKQWDTKSIFRNPRHFCTSMMKYKKQKSVKQKNPMWYSKKKNKVPRNKPNEGCKRCTQKTTQHWTKKPRKTNGSMCHVHGLEELTSSTCPYYAKQFMDSMLSLLN